jgi:hypothetical protein
MPEEVVENLGAGPEGTTGEQAQTEQGETAEATASDQETTEGCGEGSEFVMPEKFEGKSPEEIVRAYQALEKKLGGRPKAEAKTEEAFPGLDFGEAAAAVEAAPAKAPVTAATEEKPEPAPTGASLGDALSQAWVQGDTKAMDRILDAAVDRRFQHLYDQTRGQERQVERQRETLRAAYPDLVAKHDSAVFRKMQQTGVSYGDAFKTIAVADLIQKGIEHGRKIERERKGQDGGETINGGRPGSRPSTANLAEKIRTAGPSREGFNRLFPPV